MGEVRLPDYNAMPHLSPAELIAKQTEQRFSGWVGVGLEAAPTPEDYARLQAVEKAAVALLDSLQEMQFDQFTVISAPRVRVNELAEACGRKG